MFMISNPRKEIKPDKGLRYRTKPTYGNCFFGVFYLFLRGCVGEIVAINSTTRWWPYHFVMLNKYGHVIHFMHTYPDEENVLAPWWFVGHFEGIKKSEINKKLKESGREIKFRLSTAGPFMSLFFLVWILLFIPWVTAWAIYPIYWNLRWAWRALKIMFKR